MQEAHAVRKEFEIHAPSAAQLELRLHWFGRALEARRGYIVRVDRRQRGPGHVASIAYEMPLPRSAVRAPSVRRSRAAARPESAQSLLSAAGAAASRAGRGAAGLSEPAGTDEAASRS